MTSEPNPDGFIAKMRARNERLATTGDAPNTTPTNGHHAANGDHTAYTQAAANAELTNLANTTAGARNHTLNNTALKLGRLPINRVILRQDLINACHTNHLIADDGLKTVESTIDSAFGKADRDGPRPLPQKRSEKWTTNGHHPSQCIGNNDQTPIHIPLPPLEAIEQDFWEARDSLATIYQAALSRMASPWAVLGCCVARIIYQIPPAITLPAIIGGKGSLNWFAAIASKSGGGKGAAMAAAQDLIPIDDIIIRGIGSGEGMIEAYQRAHPIGKEPPPPIVAILFSLEEIDSLAAMVGRTGQTTLSVLRQGFSGEALRHSYRGRTDENVAAHTYRMTLVAGVQHQQAGALLDHAGGGTPQRFMWFPARDKRITADPPDWPKHRNGRPIIISAISRADISRAPHVIPIPDHVIRHIRENRAASMNGDDHELAGHSLFCREKLAYALAYMNGHLEIGEEDWRLSGIAADVSDWCRNKVSDDYQNAKDQRSRERGQSQALANDERNIVEHNVYIRHVARITNMIIKHLKSNGPMTAGALNRNFNNRDRCRLDAAIKSATEQNAIEFNDGKWKLV